MRNSAANNLGLILFPIVEAEIHSKTLNHVLEIGCGTGELSNRLARRAGSVTGIDISEVAVNEARRATARSNVSFKLEDFNTFDSKGTKYDLIISSFAFHHFPLQESFEKAVSLLAPGGVLIIFDMYSAHERSLGLFVFNQIVVETLESFGGAMRTIRAIGLLATLRFFRARIAFYVDRDGRAHTKEDLRNGLPPTFKEWRTAFKTLSPHNAYQQLIGAAFISTYTHE